METRWVRAYRATAAAAVAAFTAGALVLSISLPFSDWDSFAFGEWSRKIAFGGSLDPASAGALESVRPVYYLLEGALWSVTGISFTAGHLLSLAFTLAAIAGSWFLVKTVTSDDLTAALAALLVVAIPSLAIDSIAGKSDIPAAAGVAITAALVLRDSRTRTSLALISVAALISVLIKPTVIAPLVALVVYLAWRGRREVRTYVRGPFGALVAGLAAGAVYEFVMAARFHTDVISYLRTGTTDGLWGQRAAADRWHAFLRADVLGESLRVPLTFGLLYALARVCGVRHRIAAGGAALASLVWCIAGPFAAGVGNGPFDNAEAVFTFAGFALLIAATLLTRSSDGPPAESIRLGLVLGLPPLALWLYGTAYFDRLAAAAWPGLALLLSVIVAAGIRAVAKLDVRAALVPVAVIGLAAWMGITNLDGLHGNEWAAVRGLKLAGLRDKQRTTNIVLPAMQSALATADPLLGTHGRLITEDPRFAFFLPTRTKIGTPGTCDDVAGYRVFVLLTSDEAIGEAKLSGKLATPAQWEACTRPRLQALSDGSDGYVVFSVEPA